MQTDIDYGETTPLPALMEGEQVGNLGAQEQSVIRLYGVTQAGNSICAHIYNFTPYFYVEKPDGLEMGEEEI